MDYRTLDLIIVSASGLKKSRIIGKMDVYAVASISGDVGKCQKLRTRIDKNGDSDPRWNFPMKFIIDEAAGLQNLTLVVKIMAVGIFADKNLGEVHVPITKLIDGVKSEGKPMQIVSFQVRRPSGEPKGVLTLSYEVGGKFSGKVLPHVAKGGECVYQNQQPSPQPVDDWHSPVVETSRKGMWSNSGVGFGSCLVGGAIGGWLVEEMVADAGNGGGCGGGGCGGGGCGGF